MGVRVREKPKGSKVWWIFVNHHGRRRARRVGDRKAAELAATKIRAKLAEGDTSVLAAEAPAASRVPTFAELAEEWLRTYPLRRAVRPSTMENYRSFTVKHLLPAFGGRPLTDLTWKVIEELIEAKRGPGGSARFQGKGLSDVSLRAGLVTLRLILHRAVRLGHLTANPMLNVEWRGAPRIESIDPFTPAELGAILTAARSIDRDLATLLRLWAQSGMRAGEVFGLRPEDLDLDRGTALVRRTWTRSRIGPTKTGRERLVSFLHPVTEETPEWRPGATVGSWEVVAGLRRLRVQPMDPTAFLFTCDGEDPWTSRRLNRAWRRVLASARVRYRSPEQLRHTFASTLLSRNAPLLYVQQQGGWRSAGVLLRVYARWLPQDVGTVAPTLPSATQAQPSVLTVATAAERV